ncbi:hypothetical protein SAMN04487770_1316 [Butyrivibrio sp. ob235]|nr:hypothetical protein SAMN04487770_1316 [Butyrivibrio sp. ob235]
MGVSGKSLSNEKVVLEIIVEEGLPLTDIIPLYHAINKMCQFLTFRKNVFFDKVELLGDLSYSGYDVIDSFAELHVVNEFRSMTEKPWLSCVLFKEINDGIGLLFKAIIEEKEKKPHFQIDFLPDSDEDAAWITPEKIRRICTCLECEAALQSITIKGNKNFKELANRIKDIVKDHKNGDSPLPQKGDLDPMEFKKITECYYKKVDDHT